MEKALKPKGLTNTEKEIKKAITVIMARQREKNMEALCISLQDRGILKKNLFRPPLTESRPLSILISEFPGELLDTFPFPLPATGDDETTTVHAKHLNGTNAGFYSKVISRDPNIGEINLAVTIGQLFDTVYTNTVDTIPPLVFSNSTCAGLGKLIDIENPYEHEVFVKAITRVILPDHAEQVCYTEKGNLDLSFCGVEAFFDTTLGMIGPGGHSNHTNKKFLTAISDAGSNFVSYEKSFVVESIFKLPPATTQFYYGMVLTGTVSTSRDFSNPSVFENDSFGFALLDLRNRRNPHQFPIMRDPLGAWEKQPFGGALTQTIFEIYTVKNNLTM